MFVVSAMKETNVVRRSEEIAKCRSHHLITAAFQIVYLFKDQENSTVRSRTFSFLARLRISHESCYRGKATDQYKIIDGAPEQPNTVEDK